MKCKEGDYSMHKFTLLLTAALLSGSSLFPSTNRPIYTVKEGNVHRSIGDNQDKCYQASYYQQGNRNIVADVSKCNEYKK